MAETPKGAGTGRAAESGAGYGAESGAGYGTESGVGHRPGPESGPGAWYETEPVESALRTGLRAYALIAGMWIRSTMTYRVSFAMTTLADLTVTAFDFVAILLMFSYVDTLGGFSLAEIAFLYGAAATSFGITDLLLGSMDRVGRRVRDGTFDTLLVRPVPVLAQVAADRFALRRLGRITQGSVVLGWSISAVAVDWTVLKVLMVPMMLLSGAAIFGAVFVAGAAFQFWAQDASELQNSFTYGGSTLLQYPPSIFAKDLVRGVTFVVPLAFVNWLPALHVLDRPYPLDLPSWVAFTPPLVAAACCWPAVLAWRAGLRSYRSTGS
ncbi:ABC transporter permease [Streptomyces sp. NPDC020965]|uniref:ABC transporter permease n=1 Tax=Streptomyces sp. NPDC020965 TaxID=3365105 RepID=UPI0037A89741